MKAALKKKRLLFFGAAIPVIFIVTILYLKSKSEKVPSSLETWYCPSGYNNYNYSDDGMFYSEDSGIMYLDAETGKRVSVCTKAGCKHDDADCPAKVEALYLSGIVYDGNKMYYVSSSGDEEFKGLNLTECDINGTNRKQIADFSGIQTPTAVTYYGDYVIVAYRNSFDLEKREEVINQEAGIYVYNRKNNNGSIVYSAKAVENNIFSLDIIEDEIYFTRTYNPLTEDEIMEEVDEEDTAINVELHKVPITGGTAECIGRNLTSSIAGVSHVGDGVVYSAADGICMYSLKNGSTKYLAEGEGYTIVTERLTEERAVFFQYDEKNNSKMYYMIDENYNIHELGCTEYLIQVIFDSVAYAMDESGQNVILDTEKMWKKVWELSV